MYCESSFTFFNFFFSSSINNYVVINNVNGFKTRASYELRRNIKNREFFCKV